MRRKINRERLRHRYKETRKAHAALMKFYPFTLVDLEGEKWRDFPCYNGDYQISTFGRVKSFKRKMPRILKPSFNEGGYLWVALCKNGVTKNFCIHTLVAITFIPNPNNLPEVNHIDTHKFNCHVSNLEWTNHGDNMQHATNMGLIKMGEDNPQAKLTNEQVRYIRENPDGLTGVELAKKLGVSNSAIGYIQRGITYKVADGKIRDKKKERVPDEIRIKIREEYKKYVPGCGLEDIAKKYDLTSRTIWNIIREGDN